MDVFSIETNCLLITDSKDSVHIMNIINEKVRHKSPSLGEGTIIEHNGSLITVAFKTKVSKFKFPEAFSEFLVSDNPEMAKYITAEMERIEREKSEQKQRYVEELEAEKTRKREEQIQKPKKTYIKNTGANYAFKCNYCDGNANESKIGFSGVCSDKVIHNNIVVERRIWCNQPECLCMKYHLGEITRDELDELSKTEFVCYEAEMLTKWLVQAGTNTTTKTARRISEASPGKLCVLTTRDPNLGTEADRYVFAAFIIQACNEGDEYEVGRLYANPEYTICLNDYEAHKVKFWDYHINKNAPDKKVWGMGLYRKYDDEEAIRFLDAIIKVKEGKPDYEQAKLIKAAFIRNNQ